MNDTEKRGKLMAKSPMILPDKIWNKKHRCQCANPNTEHDYEECMTLRKTWLLRKPSKSVFGCCGRKLTIYNQCMVKLCNCGKYIVGRYFGGVMGRYYTIYLHCDVCGKTYETKEYLDIYG